MTGIVKKSFSAPDETMNPGEKLKVEVVAIGDLKFMKVTAEPGWQWSLHKKQVDKTEYCEKDHLIYLISGTLASKMKDGEAEEFNPGDIFEIPSGHDGWTVGDQPTVWLEIPH